MKYLSLKNKIKRKNGIVIVGADRSGTTLMQLLLNFGFENTDSKLNELSINEIYKHNDINVDNENFLITKKTYDSIIFDKIINYIGYYVIFMIRDPRDLCVSKMFLNNFSKYWQNPSDIYHKLQNFISIRYNDYFFNEINDRLIILKYEDLVANPNKIQKIIQDRIQKLKFRKKFTYCIEEFSEIKDDGSLKYLNRLKGSKDNSRFRSIDKNNVCKWKKYENLERMKEILKNGSESFYLQAMLEFLNYEDNCNWMKNFLEKKDE